MWVRLCVSALTLFLVFNFSASTSQQDAYSDVQQSSSNAHRWTSVDRTSIATIDLKGFGGGYLQTTIPDVIPNNAQEILVLVSAEVKSSSSDIEDYMKIYTRIYDYTSLTMENYEQYLLIRHHANGARLINSDNMWFPFPPDRHINIKPSSTYGYSTSIQVTLHAIGYR